MTLGKIRPVFLFYAAFAAQARKVSGGMERTRQWGLYEVDAVISRHLIHLTAHVVANWKSLYSFLRPMYSAMTE